ncbi:cytochrome c family protein [Xinfangfangia sp. CPCC 101601]|uniref:Cytochrome c family protein n=1 Tax=Pseudogemmobacter lacusdianii TaxID=3069608 RepID=A0ABU0VYV2_9RHOB|nr:cytochrome c family protein [Xinfangfangia sp. CPCC 101601]MDQ2066818.1 cytochrome c family protein [Xinfangfangia sp. CPCC 101601]
MFDTMTMTKATAGVCGALLVFLLGKWAATDLYAMGGGHGAEGELTQAYAIDTGAAAPSGEEAPAVDVAALLAAGDAVAGEKAFGKCKACHKLDGSNGTGPHLDGVVNRGKGAVAGYNYSEALKAMSAETWTPENLYHFIQSPKGYMPGTKMAFGGIPKPEEISNLVAFLATK